MPPSLDAALRAGSSCIGPAMLPAPIVPSPGEIQAEDYVRTVFGGSFFGVVSATPFGGWRGLEQHGRGVCPDGSHGGLRAGDRVIRLALTWYYPRANRCWAPGHGPVPARHPRLPSPASEPPLPGVLAGTGAALIGLTTFLAARLR